MFSWSATVQFSMHKTINASDGNFFCFCFAMKGSGAWDEKRGREAERLGKC